MRLHCVRADLDDGSLWPKKIWKKKYSVKQKSKKKDERHPPLFSGIRSSMLQCT
jgi:hypothetical protein